MYACLIFLILAMSSPLWACQEWLQSSHVRMDFSALEFSKRAVENLNKLYIHPEQVSEALVKPSFGLPWGKQDLRTFAFVKDSAGVATPVLLKATQTSEGFRIVSARRADYKEERDYFRYVGYLHDMKPRILKLDREIAGCSEIEVDPDVENKILLKHELTLDQVLESINASKMVRVARYHDFKLGDYRTFEFRNPETRQWMTAIVQEFKGCPHSLRTFFSNRSRHIHRSYQ